MEIDELLDGEWVEENQVYLDDGDGFDEAPLIPNSQFLGMGQFFLIYDL
jgi:hypothetical protein